MKLRDARKPAVAILVLSLHAALLAFLVQRDRWPAAQQRFSGPEIVFVRIAPPAPESPREHRPHRAQSPKPRARIVSPFVLAPFTAPPTRAPSGLSDLHGGLFDCAPETLAGLKPEQRAECGHTASAMAHRNPDVIPWPNNKYAPTKNTWRWARNVQRKNAPPLLPCANPTGISPIATALCLANAAVNGFDAEHKPEYFDHPEQVGVPNGGDPPMTPEH